MASFDDDCSHSDFDETREFLSSREKPRNRHRYYNRHSKLRRAVQSVAGAVSYAFLTAMFVFVTLSFLPSQSTSGATTAAGTTTTKHIPAIQRAPCGSSASEAQALGCTFDIISFAWLAPACYDAELSQAFDALAEWEWFLDVNQTQRVPKADALTGRYPVLYVDWEYHITHCTYMWKKMHRALLAGGGGLSAIDGYIGPYEHTEHCSHMLLSGRDWDLKVVNTGIRVKYPDCGLARGDSSVVDVVRK